MSDAKPVVPAANLAIDGDRLWDTHHGNRADRRHAEGRRSSRLTLTDLDRQVRDWFASQMRSGRLHRAG